MAIPRATTMISASVLLAVLVGGCTREVVGMAVEKDIAEGTSSACTQVLAPMMPVPAEADDEPRIFVPQPSGWHRKANTDSELVRFAIANARLMPPSLAIAAVALESHEGHDDPASVFDDVRADAENDPETTDLMFTDTTVCGYPAKSIDYTKLATDELPTRSETMLVVVVHTADKTHAAVVTISTNGADNPAYQRDRDTILTGFQVLAPT